MRNLLALPVMALTALSNLFRPEPVITFHQAAAVQGRFFDPGIK